MAHQVLPAAGAAAHRLISAWEAQVSLKKFDHLVQVEKFARNPVVNTVEEDLWPLGGIHTDLITGTSLYISSNDATADQTIKVVGIDGNWDEQTVFVNLTGRTPALVGDLLNWTTVHRAYQVSAAPNALEDVYIAVAGAAYTLGVPDDLADVQAFIDFGSEQAHQTEQGWIIVPAGHQFLLWEMAGDMNHSGGTARTAEILLEVAELAIGSTVESPLWTPYRRIHDVAVATAGSTRSQEDWKFPQVFGELTRVVLRATATSNSELSGEYKGLIVPL